MDEKKIPPPFTALLFCLLVVISFQFISLILVQLITAFLPDISFAEMSRMIFILSGFYLVGFLLIYLRYRDYDTASLLRTNKIPAESAILSIITGIVLTILSSEIDVVRQLIIPNPEWFETIIKNMTADSTLDLFLLIIGMVIAASISEELLFRGFLQVSLERSGDITRAVILSSFAWTAVHLNIFWAVQTFAAGVIIGFLAWRSRSTYAAILAHGSYNLASLLMFNYSESFSWMLWGEHISPLVFLPALLVLIWTVRRFTDIHRAMATQ